MGTVLLETRPSFPIAEGFASRLELEKGIFDCIKQHGEKWPLCSGLYNSCANSLIDLMRIPSRLYTKIANLVPPTFHCRLEKFVEHYKSIKPANQPIIILDLGGGQGQSWTATASFFKDDIKAGKVAFLVSNLTGIPTSNNETAKVNRNEIPVHFVESPFRQLCVQEITLPNGQVLPLEGNVDLVHDCNSLTRWSLVPELDIPSVCSLLSKQGSFFIAPGNKPCRYDRLNHLEATVNQSQRWAAVNMCYYLMQERYGLLDIDHVESGEYQDAGLLYKVFRKQEAPLITI